MPWTSTDRDAIAIFLSIPFLDHTLAQVTVQMTRLESLSPQGVTRAQGYLARLTAIDADITAAATALTAGVVAIANDNPVEFASGQPLNVLRDEGWRYINLLGDLLQLTIGANYFDIPSMVSNVQSQQKINRLQRS